MAHKDKIIFNKEVSRLDLEKGVEFSVEPRDLDFTDEDEPFNEEEFNNFKERLTELAIENEDLENLPFDILRTKMKPLTDDGHVLKKILKYGTGDVIPEKSIVVMHYNAYIENCTEPFDSTYRRNLPFKFLVGEGRVIPGLDIAICTMKKDEMSKLLIDSDYAYGSLGCPPRIPAQATILYEVQIINYVDCRDAIEFEEMTPEERKKAVIEQVLRVVSTELKMGNDYVSKSLYRSAISRYRKAINLLEDVEVLNEEEDNTRHKHLEKLYLNLAHCYLKIKNSERAIIYSDLALKINDNNPKALYRMGHALLMNNEFEKGKVYLMKLKRIKPYDKDVNALLSEFDKKMKIYDEVNRSFCKRIFGNVKNNENNVNIPENLESIEFQKIILSQIETFKASNEEEFWFSPGYTKSQIETIHYLAKENDLDFIEKIHNNEKIIKFKKK